MALRKIAIALPQELRVAVARAANERNESRNRFVTRALRDAVRTSRDADITRRLDAVFVDTEMAKDQARHATQLDAAGSSWSDERW